MAGYVRDPRPYELMVIIVPDISDDEIAAELTRIQTFIGDIGADLKDVLTDSPWGRRRLAYTIRFNSIDYRDGYYAVIHFSARPDSLPELERELKLDTKVVRYLLVHDDPKAGIREPNNPDRAAEAQEAPAPAAAPETPAVETPAAEASTDDASDAPATTEAPAAEETAEEPAAEAAAPETAEDAPAETSEEE